MKKTTDPSIPIAAVISLISFFMLLSHFILGMSYLRVIEVIAILVLTFIVYFILSLLALSIYVFFFHSKKKIHKSPSYFSWLKQNEVKENGNGKDD